MSYMKCPFCNQELDRDLKGECGCINEQCQKSVFMFGSEELWQELIRTRKALDAAIRRLDQMTWGCDSSDAEHLLKEIKEITTQEQKD